jgi:nitroreductase
MEALQFLRNLKSPRAFDPDRPVSAPQIKNLIEAFRWSPSSFNKQPWRLIIINDKAQQERIHEAMSEWNQSWVPRAPLLMAVLGNPEEQDEPDGRPQYMMDCGLAIENLLLQGCAMDLAIHAIVGWKEETVKEILAVPDPFRIVALVAIGHPGRMEDLPEAVQETEKRPTSRKAVKEFVFQDRFGDAFG